MYKNLRQLRENLKMTQKEFAASLSIGLTTYNGYETGARDPKSDFWIAVAKKYGVTIDYLMGYSDDPHKTSDCNEKAPAALPGGLDREETTIITIYRSLPQEGKSVLYQVADYIYRATSPQHDRSEIERAVDASLAIERQAAKDTAHSQLKSQEVVG